MPILDRIRGRLTIDDTERTAYGSYVQKSYVEGVTDEATVKAAYPNAVATDDPDVWLPTTQSMARPNKSFIYARLRSKESKMAVILSTIRFKGIKAPLGLNIESYCQRCLLPLSGLAACNTRATIV